MLSQLLQAFQRLVSQLKSQFVWVRCWLPLPRHFYGFRRETESRARLRLRVRERLRRNPANRASHQRNRRTQRRHLVMDYIFECFFDHLSSIIKGCSGGQNSQTDEVAAIAVTAAMRYHQMAKEQNGQVSFMYKSSGANVAFLSAKLQ